MRWTSYRSPTDARERAALLLDDELLAVDRTLLEVLRSEEPLSAWAERATARPWERRPAGATPLLAPIPEPPSVRDFMAFESHVVTSYAALGAELSPVWYEQPVFYFSNPAILGPYDDVPMAPGTHRWDFELEVAAVSVVVGVTSPRPPPRTTSPATSSSATGAPGTSRHPRSPSGSGPPRARTPPRAWVRGW